MHCEVAGECFLDTTGTRLAGVVRLHSPSQGFRVLSCRSAQGESWSDVLEEARKRDVPLAQVTSGAILFDGLYAMAMDDLRQCAVDCIRDGAFNGGQPLHDRTGENWPYVWTRDTAYAAFLSLASVDPPRVVNSLLFKASPFKPEIAEQLNSRGGDIQIVQDTGTGGSYPVSSDRVTWALGAREALKYLYGAERARFVEVVFPALRSAIEVDRTLIYDQEDGLYRGETSFLDWREQTYPTWVKDDLAYIAGSKSLSTNLAHFACISLASSLAIEQGDRDLSERYSSWASSLRKAINATFYCHIGDNRGMYAMLKGPTLHPTVIRHYDLLGSALAVLLLGENNDDDERFEQQARSKAVLATYPHAPFGPPVIHPQHRGVPVYHNGAMWPFVTALWVKAAVEVGNWKVVNHGLWSLIRSSALHLSNMENMEFLTGDIWMEAGPLSGPVVNSKRQLWSVAGFISMAHDVVFGLRTRDAGNGEVEISFSPFITRWMRKSLLRNAEHLQLQFSCRGKQILLKVLLPRLQEEYASASIEPLDISILLREGGQGDVQLDLEDGSTYGGCCRIASVTVNGVLHSADTWLNESTLLAAPHVNEWTIVLSTAQEDRLPSTTAEINLLGFEKDSHYAPLEPTITRIGIADGKIQLDIHNNSQEEVRFDIFRNGTCCGQAVTSPWTDLDSENYTNILYFYSAQAVNRSGLKSRESAPVCLPLGKERVFGTSDMISNGGVLNQDSEISFYCYWGERDHWLMVVQSFSPEGSGNYAVQLLFSNGAGQHRTGIACAVKWLMVFRLVGERGRQLESKQVIVMPQHDAWDIWKWSTAVKIKLYGDCSYDLVICDDDTASSDRPLKPVEGAGMLMNMSYLDHFTSYTNDGHMLGGGQRTANFVNIAQLRLLLLQREET